MNNKIDDFRKEYNMSKTELAKELGISRQYLRQIEKGSSIPSVDIAKRIADLFDVSIDDIFFANDVVHDLQNGSVPTS